MEESKARYRTGANFYFHVGPKKSTKRLVVVLTLKSFLSFDLPRCLNTETLTRKKNNWNY